MQKVYLICGVPGAGKSWVCSQLSNEFTYVPHDNHIHEKDSGLIYVRELIKAAHKSVKPVVGEAPFSISKTKDPLEAAGVDVVPVFIDEQPGVLMQRYRDREKKEIPQQHLTRANTFRSRAEDWKSFSGTAQEVLAHLKSI